MSKKKWVVELSTEERVELLALIAKGKTAAGFTLKARILLKADEGSGDDGWTDERIAKALESNVIHVARVRRQCVEDGMAAVFIRKKRTSPPRPLIFDGKKEAQLIAVACSEPPQGFARWTIRLLAEKCVEMEIVETVHYNTVGRTLKKMHSNRT